MTFPTLAQAGFPPCAIRGSARDTGPLGSEALGTGPRGRNLDRRDTTRSRFGGMEARLEGIVWSGHIHDPGTFRLSTGWFRAGGRAPALQAGGHRFDPGTLIRRVGTRLSGCRPSGLPRRIELVQECE